MTDLEKFRELYTGLGIPFELHSQPDRNYGKEQWVETSSVVLMAKSHPKLDGYDGFCTTIVFDKQGKFLKQLFWE
jgi:hypothetical protein